MLWELSVTEQRYRAVLEVLGVSLEAFVGHPAYGTAQLRQDLNRFTFLLGGDDGESLFGHGAAE
jgi:hypothetical protein